MTIQKKSFNNPDSVMTPPLTRAEIVKIGEFSAIKYAFEPGWKWSKDVGPVAGTETCQLHHYGIQTKGHLRVRGSDGQEVDIGPGDVIDIPPGHDAWVVGDEAVDFYSFDKETSPKKE